MIFERNIDKVVSSGSQPLWFSRAFGPASTEEVLSKAFIAEIRTK